MGAPCLLAWAQQGCQTFQEALTQASFFQRAFLSKLGA